MAGDGFGRAFGGWNLPEVHRMAASFGRSPGIPEGPLRMHNDLLEAAMLESIQEQLCGPHGRVPGNGPLVLELRPGELVQHPSGYGNMQGAPGVAILREG